MRKFSKIFLSLLLLVAIILSCASCDIINRIKYERSYTGGFPPGIPLKHRNHFNTSYYCWFETLDELLATIEILKASGKEVDATYIPNYENEIVDAKYCISYTLQGNEKRVEKGKEWYDREGLKIERIFYFGFVDKITIDEIVRTYITVHFRCFLCIQTEQITPDTPLYYDYSPKNDDEYLVRTLPDKLEFARIIYYNMEIPLAELPGDFTKEFPKSFVLIGE